MTPQRVQLSRTKGWRKPDNTVVVSRPSYWGNPYKVGDLIRDPINSTNPIAAVVGEWESEGAHERLSHVGKTYTVTCRRVIDRADAVELFRRLYEFEGWDVSELAGHNLACWCPLGQPCHADVLLELANRTVA